MPTPAAATTGVGVFAAWGLARAYYQAQIVACIWARGARLFLGSARLSPITVRTMSPMPQPSGHLNIVGQTVVDYGP